jgi:LysR family nitrogen assimilation transcriptional regulator
MDSIRSLKLFVAAYEEKSFSLAAIRAGATQSGVSQHIRKIEERFGTDLFLRLNDGVHPTPAADVFYRHCLEILRNHSRAVDELKSFGNGLSGEVRVGLMHSMTYGVASASLRRFTDAYPNVRVRIVEANSFVLTEQTLAGALDFAIVPQGGLTLNSVRAEPFGVTCEYLVSAAGSGVRAHLEPVNLRSIPPQRYVLPGGQNVRRTAIDAYFSANEIDVGRIIEFDAILGILDLVATTDFVSILPGIMIYREMDGSRFCLNKLTNPPLRVRLQTIQPSRNSMSQAAELFLGHLAEEYLKASRTLAEVTVDD